MSDFKRITKIQTRLLKHLLSATSGDSWRPIMMCINVDIEKNQIGAANGFVLTFVQYEKSELEEIFPESGMYNVTLGKIGKDNIAEISRFTESGITYPNLNAVVHDTTLAPKITFGVSKSLLTELIKGADGMVVIHVWDEKSTLEFQYSAQGVPCYSVLMPMNASDNTKLGLWHPVKFVPLQPHIEKPI